MTMTEFQDKQIRLTVKTLVVWAIGIVSIVSSFWIGYGSIMSKLNTIEGQITIQNIRIENEVEKGSGVHDDLERRIVDLENK